MPMTEIYQIEVLTPSIMNCKFAIDDTSYCFLILWLQGNLEAACRFIAWCPDQKVLLLFHFFFYVLSNLYSEHLLLKLSVLVEVPELLELAPQTLLPCWDSPDVDVKDISDSRFLTLLLNPNRKLIGSYLKYRPSSSSKKVQLFFYMQRTEVFCLGATQEEKQNLAPSLQILNQN